MYRNFFSVSGITLLSRLAGFFRDVMVSALIGAGMMGDAFAVAIRLPSHFRAIFGEGAFNAAYVPTYLRIYEQSDIWAARHFANQIFTLLVMSQIVTAGAGLAVHARFGPSPGAGFSPPSRKNSPSRSN